MKNVLAIQDLQFGSTGKGQIAGGIAHVWGPDTVVTAWGPNAGHTFRMGELRFVSTMLATSAICPTVEQILIGPGSVVNLRRLAEEITTAKVYLQGKHLIIHPQAVIVADEHLDREAKELLQIGSTMKGTGAALCDKVMRKECITVKQRHSLVYESLGIAVVGADMSLSLSSKVYDRAVDTSFKMMVEGAQGFSLGYHNDFFPHATSRDVSTAQLLADCRLPFPTSEHRFRVIGVCRTFPIRVANRHKDGITYSSGGHYDDQKELDWKTDLGREPELTTVTKLPRRIFSFSHEQIVEACRIMGPAGIALTFCDYVSPPPELVPMVATEIPEAVHAYVSSIEQVTGKGVYLLSFGPQMEDIREIRQDGLMHALSAQFLGGDHD